MGVLIHPISTEKAVGMIDRNNIITYMVDFRASKKEIREEFEKMFGVKVERVRSLNTFGRSKKVFIKIVEGQRATDVAQKLKLV